MVTMTSATCHPTEALKFHLAMEISRIPDQPAVHCATHRIKPISRFVDWYLVLRVEEDADTESIRKQYHKLALLLHPDKNRHPKAEIAFKLVSEAYECLIDKPKRRAFNLDRSKRKNNICYDCNNLPNTTIASDESYRHANWRRNEPHSTLNSRVLKEIGRRMEEEARVIENCLRINRKTRNEYPVFSPSNYVNQGYPHQQRRDYRGLENVGCFGRANIPDFRRRVKCESPVFELSRRDCIPLNYPTVLCSQKKEPFYDSAHGSHFMLKFAPRDCSRCLIPFKGASSSSCWRWFVFKLSTVACSASLHFPATQEQDESYSSTSFADERLHYRLHSCKESRALNSIQSFQALTVTMCAFAR
ncbi:hypothetical protein V2J09_013435 [Rumex salicifolius]